MASTAMDGALASSYVSGETFGSDVGTAVTVGKTSGMGVGDGISFATGVAVAGRGVTTAVASVSGKAVGTGDGRSVLAGPVVGEGIAVLVGVSTFSPTGEDIGVGEGTG